MPFCRKCGRWHERPGIPVPRWCERCHASYMREWRKDHPMSHVQRIRGRARSIAGISKRRGKLIAEPCRICGAAAEMHHPDYGQPLNVEWLCRAHHLQLHRETAKESPMKT